jgi:hypothetical protein
MNDICILHFPLEGTGNLGVAAMTIYCRRFVSQQWVAMNMRCFGLSTEYMEVVKCSMRAYSIRSISLKSSLPVAIAYFILALTADILGAHFTGSEGAFSPRKVERHPLLVSVLRNNWWRC